MNARARTEGVVTRLDGTSLVVRAPGGAEHRLTPVAAAVWAAADGSRTVDELAAVASDRVGCRVDRETVFTALDGLADAGLLVARVAPPAGELPRRALLRSAAAGLGAIAAGAAFFASARVASAGGEESAKEAQQKRDLEHAKDQEQRTKEHAEQQQKEDASKEEREKDRAEQQAKESEEKVAREKQRAEQRAKEEAAKGG